jgi:mRNA interferase MazF
MTSNTPLLAAGYFIDSYSIPLDEEHFEAGSLNRKSNIRPNRIFTADKKIMLYKTGHLKKKKSRKQ